MVKNKIDEKICRDCEKQIIGRRADAIICKDCRREAQVQASQNIKEQEKEERLWRKVKESNVKTKIEYEKAQKILRKLESGPSKNEDEFKVGWLQILGLRKKNNPLYSFEMNCLFEEIETLEMKPLWEFIERKVKERLGQEIIKIRVAHRNNFNTLS